MHEPLLLSAEAASDCPTPSRSADADDELAESPLDPHACCACLWRLRRSPSSVLFVVSLALCVDLLVYCIIIPVLPLFVEHRLHGSSAAIGLLFACYAAGLLLATPASALWSDRTAGRRTPMLVGLSAMAAATLCFSVANSLWQLALARFAQGVSAAVTNTVGLAMVADVYPSSQLPAQMAIVMSVSGLGGLAGPPLGGALYQHLSYLSVFIVCGALAVLDFVLRVILIDDDWLKRQRGRIRRQAIKEQEDEDAAEATPHDHAPLVPNTVPVSALTHVTVAPAYPSLDPSSSNAPQPEAPLLVPPPHVPIGLWGLLRVRTLQVTLFGVFVIATVFTGLEPLLALHFDSEFGSSSTAIGLSNLAIALPYLASATIAAHYQEQGVHPKLIVAVGTALLTLSCATLWLPSSLYVSLAPMCVFGLALGAGMAPGLGEIGEWLTRTRNQAAFAQGFALFNGCYAVGMMMGPILSGFVYEHTSFRDTMGVMAAMAAATTLILIVVGMRERREASEAKSNKAHTQAAATPSPQHVGISMQAPSIHRDDRDRE